MTGRTDSNRTAACARRACGRRADFWVYRPGEDGWEALCRRHTLERHPSLEVHAWLESGYARPAELGPPDDPPAPPRDDRTAAFRDFVERALDVSE